MFFLPQSEGTWQSIQTGTFLAYEKRPFWNRFWVFPLKLNPGQPQVIFLRVQAKGSALSVPLALETEVGFYAQSLPGEVGYGIFFGMLALVVLLNLFLFGQLRQSRYFFYACFALCLGLLSSYLSGHLFQFPVFRTLVISSDWFTFFILCTHISGLLFAIDFLDLPHYLPGRSRFLYRFIPISLFIYTCYLLTQRRAWLIAVHLSGLAVALFTIFSAFQVSLRRHSEARFYLYAYGLLILGALPVIGGALGLWAESWLTQHGFEAGILAEVLTLSLALTDKQRRSLEAQKAAQAETIRVQQEANQQLEEKVRLRTAQWQEANEEIASQRDVLEEQNRNIMASIQAARRIQEAILPSLEQMHRLFPDFFVFYRPLQVVSGDLFWWEKVRNKVVIAAIDCTGHGVPGAFQSLMAYDLLNRVVLEKQILDPAAILNEMHHGVMAQMRASDAPTHYGMDAALCVLDLEKRELCFCGAHNSLIYFQEGQLYEVKGAQIAIGDPSRFALRKFDTFRLHLNQATTFYLFSDGLQDQFGGPQNRKFTPRRLRELLHKIHLQPLAVQRQMLETVFEDWQGPHKQIDDVLVMGFRWLARS
ncbi:MAG: hypothetical protein OHK0053_02470 [Microscillaceae bacterium]